MHFQSNDTGLRLVIHFLQKRVQRHFRNFWSIQDQCFLKAKCVASVYYRVYVHPELKMAVCGLYEFKYSSSVNTTDAKEEKKDTSFHLSGIDSEPAINNYTWEETTCSRHHGSDEKKNNNQTSTICFWCIWDKFIHQNCSMS